MDEVRKTRPNRSRRPVIAKVPMELEPGPTKETPSSVEAELARVAELLHDDVLQAFAVCLLKAELCEGLLRQERYDQLKVELPLLQDALNDTIDHVRALIVQLRRPSNRAVL